MLQGAKSSSFTATIPNREIAEWFSNQSSGNTVSFDIPPNMGNNLLGVALWVVYTCKSEDSNYTLEAIITNETQGTKQDYCNDYVPGGIVGEIQSTVDCMSEENFPLKSGDRIKVSFEEGGDVDVEMCGAHLIQKTPRASD